MGSYSFAADAAAAEVLATFLFCFVGVCCCCCCCACCTCCDCCCMAAEALDDATEVRLGVAGNGRSRIV